MNNCLVEDVIFIVSSDGDYIFSDIGRTFTKIVGLYVSLNGRLVRAKVIGEGTVQLISNDDDGNEIPYKLARAGEKIYGKFYKG